MKKGGIILIVILTALVFGVATQTSWVHSQEKLSPEGRLAVIWSSGDPEVAHRACLMYAHNAKWPSIPAWRFGRSENRSVLASPAGFTLRIAVPQEVRGVVVVRLHFHGCHVGPILPLFR